MRMKITDDYEAKYRLWAANPTVVPAPAATRSARLQKQAVFLACGIECLEAFHVAATGAFDARPMNELLLALNTAGIRYLLVGGQAMRLAGMPRFSMDWDFFIPPHDENNFIRLNEVLRDEIDVPLVALGSRGENFIQTYQTRWGFCNFILACPACRVLTKRKRRQSSVIRNKERP